MVFDMLNDVAESAPAILLFGVILTLVGLRHIVMPDGSLVQFLGSFILNDQAASLAARIAGLVVTSGGLGFVGNALDEY